MINFNYLATSRDIERLGPNEVSHYRYLGLIEWGSLEAQVPEAEMALTRLMLDHHRREEMLLVLASSLRSASSDCFLCELFEFLRVATPTEPHLAMVKRTEGIGLARFDDDPIVEPLRLEIVASERRPYLHAAQSAVQNALSRLDRPAELGPPPKLSQMDNLMVVPDSDKIMKLRSLQGSQSAVYETARSGRRAESFVALRRDTLEEIGKQLGEKWQCLLLRHVVINCHYLRSFIEEAGHDRQHLAEVLKLPGATTFDQLLSGDPVDPLWPRYLQAKIERELGEKHSQASFIDIPATLALRPD